MSKRPFQRNDPGFPPYFAPLVNRPSHPTHGHPNHNQASHGIPMNQGV